MYNTFSIAIRCAIVIKFYNYVVANLLGAQLLENYLKGRRAIQSVILTSLF